MKGKQATVNQLVRLGARGYGGNFERPDYAEVVARARAFAADLLERLPRWLAALDNPLTVEAYREIDGLDVFLSNDGADVAEQALALADFVHFGIARTSHDGKAPECPGYNRGDGPRCGNPVAREHSLCYRCEAEAADAEVRP